MADGIGETRDRVELKLNGFPLMLAESYSIQTSLFEVPSIFNLTLGIPSDALAAVLQKLPPRLKFELSIDGRHQFDGFVDAVSVSTNAQATQLTIRGRDALAPLVDRYVTAEQTFKGSTIVELVETVLALVYGDECELQYSAEIAKRRITGDDSLKQSPSAGAVESALSDNGGDALVAVSPTSAAGKVLAAKQRYVMAYEAASPLGEKFKVLNQFIAAELPMLPGMDETKLRAVFTEEHNLVGGATQVNIGTVVTTGSTSKPPEPQTQAKLGERWYDSVIKPELDRAGLFLYYVGNGIFVLSATDPQAPAVARIERRLNGKLGPGAHIVSSQYTNDTTRRYTSATVHARAGGGAETRSNLADVVTDAEMVALGYERPFTRKDAKSKQLKQAQFLALKHLCEGRRQGRRLEYTFSGHTTIGLSGRRICWCHDTTVDVEDELLGLSGKFYIESVEHQSHPEKTTTIRLMRPEDCLFGEGAAGSDGTI